MSNGIQLSLVEIGRHYNSEYMFGLTMEECAELTQALNKLNRYKAGEYKGKLEQLEEHLFEEIADVELCLQILKNKYKCEEEVYRWKQKKVERWQERIKLSEC